MDEGPYACPVADDRQLALAYELDEITLQGESGAWAVEVAETQCKPFEARRPQGRRLAMADRAQRTPLIAWRVRIKGSIFILGLGPGAFVIPVAIALRDEAARPGCVGGLDQIVSSLGAQSIGQGEFLIESLQALRLG